MEKVAGMAEWPSHGLQNPNKSGALSQSLTTSQSKLNVFNDLIAGATDQGG